MVRIQVGALDKFFIGSIVRAELWQTLGVLAMAKAKSEPNESVAQVTRIFGTDGHLDLLPDTGDDLSVQIEAINDGKQVAVKLAHGSDLDGLIEQLLRIKKLLAKAYEDACRA